jgi:hypothetical protein
VLFIHRSEAQYLTWSHCWVSSAERSTNDHGRKAVKEDPGVGEPRLGLFEPPHPREAWDGLHARGGERRPLLSRG